MKVLEWMEHLEKLAPVSMACQWDNPGLLAGRGEKEVKKVLIALDATDEVVDMAVEEQVDLLLTHHPLIFKGVKKGGVSTPLCFLVNHSPIPKTKKKRGGCDRH